MTSPLTDVSAVLDGGILTWTDPDVPSVDPTSSRLSTRRKWPSGAGRLVEGGSGVMVTLLPSAAVALMLSVWSFCTCAVDELATGSATSAGAAAKLGATAAVERS